MCWAAPHRRRSRLRAYIEHDDVAKVEDVVKKFLLWLVQLYVADDSPLLKRGGNTTELAEKPVCWDCSE